jgi:hypothetical protein
MRTLKLALVAAVLLIGACGNGKAAPVIDPGDGGNYHPTIDPANFVGEIDNPYLPWVVGSKWVYEGEADGNKEHTEVTVLDETRDIMGIPTTVVHDVVSVDGVIIEDTLDWYAQDRDGNVWYFGEDVKNYENGKFVDSDGSWEAGVDGALPGIVMLAHPQVGDAYRQEYLAGEAEDLGMVLQLDASVTVPLDSYDNVLVTRDWNPLEPELIEEKSYAQGIGLVFEEATTGAKDTAGLVSYEP